ncbi:MAG: hypothetical protein AAF487_02935 [Bacteroidota bacterium]
MRKQIFRATFILFLICSCNSVISKKDIQINGSVSQENGNRVSGMEIKVNYQEYIDAYYRPWKSIHTISDNEGNYSLDLPGRITAVNISFFVKTPDSLKLTHGIHEITAYSYEVNYYYSEQRRVHSISNKTKNMVQTISW